MDMAKTSMDDGDNKTAEVILLEAAAIDNTKAGPYHLMALIAYQNGRLEESGNKILEAITRDDHDPVIHSDCGAIMNTLGRPAEAEAACRHVIDLDPDYIEAYNNLSVALSLQNRLEEALEICDSVLNTHPDYIDALINKASLLLKLDDPAAAIEIFTNVVKMMPSNLIARISLAAALRLVGELGAAEDQCQICIDLEPNYPEAHVGLGMVLATTGDYLSAQTSFNKALDLRPAFAAAQLNLAAARFKNGELLAAEKNYQEIINSHPDSASAHTGLGIVLLSAGKHREAVAAFRSAVTLDPSQGDAWMNIASSPGSNISDSDIAIMESLVEDVRLNSEARIAILFALGESRDKKGDYGDAFTNFQKANYARQQKMKKFDQVFDPIRIRHIERTIVSKFTNMSSFTQNRNTSQQPVFVLGMPRSGTTLIAQIIASHPNAESRGELAAISKFFPDFPDNIELSNNINWAPKVLSEFNSDSQWVVDKAPFQFMHIGLIRKIFPKAPIIICRRAQEDIAISCYFQNFVADYPWSTDLEHIGRFISFHNRVISFWKSLFPNTIHEVSYEALVSNFDTESQRLLEYIGLPWDDACLNFFENKNAVFSASNWQVRQPIYTSSVGRAKFYKAHLKPLYRGLSFV
mgnify:CR=1 FL=1